MHVRIWYVLDMITLQTYVYVSTCVRTSVRSIVTSQVMCTSRHHEIDVSTHIRAWRVSFVSQLFMPIRQAVYQVGLLMESHTHTRSRKDHRLGSAFPLSFYLYTWI